MKSVVVEASTVAKAVEAAWLKAGKPEEFFIRILQEHSSGFLGFGALKAKVVFFFKNSQKSDSLFPVVLKQKEYASFFGNFSLKVPTELNSIDHELNKNVSLGNNQNKKKPNNNQNNQHKPKQNNQHSDVKSRLHNELNTKPTAYQADKHVNADKSLQGSAVKQVKIQHPVRPQQQSIVKNSDHLKSAGAQVEKPVHNKPKMQVSLQASEPTKEFIEQKVVLRDIERKDDVVKNIAKVLKKVQTQKVIANVSRPIHAPHDKSLQKTDEGLKKAGVYSSRPTEKPKFTTPKFENYTDFINSTTGVPIVKEKVVEALQVAPVASKIESLQSLHDSIQNLESFDKRAGVVEKKEVVMQVQAKPITQAPRVPLKMKRRPLTTENPGVSGITRSVQVSEAVKTVTDTTNDMSKNEKE